MSDPIFNLFFLGTDVTYQKDSVPSDSHPNGDLLSGIFNAISLTDTNPLARNIATKTSYDNGINSYQKTDAVIIDGPETQGRNAQNIIQIGIKSVDKWIDENKIDTNNAFNINILGFSRGGVEAICATHILAEKYPHATFTLNAIDPVPGHFWKDGYVNPFWGANNIQLFTKELPKAVTDFNLFLMEHEVSRFFEPIIPKWNKNTKGQIIPLYGNHSTGAGNLFEQNKYALQQIKASIKTEAEKKEAILELQEKFKFSRNTHNIITNIISKSLLTSKVSLNIVDDKKELLTNSKLYNQHLLELFNELYNSKNDFDQFYNFTYPYIGASGNKDRWVYYKSNVCSSLNKISEKNARGFVNTAHEMLWLENLFTELGFEATFANNKFDKENKNIISISNFLNNLFNQLEIKIQNDIHQLQDKKQTIENLVIKYSEILLDAFYENGLSANEIKDIKPKIDDCISNIKKLVEFNIIDKNLMTNKLNENISNKILALKTSINAVKNILNCPDQNITDEEKIETILILLINFSSIEHLNKAAHRIQQIKELEQDDNENIQTLVNLHQEVKEILNEEVKDKKYLNNINIPLSKRLQLKSSLQNSSLSIDNPKINELIAEETILINSFNLWRDFNSKRTASYYTHAIESLDSYVEKLNLQWFLCIEIRLFGLLEFFEVQPILIFARLGYYQKQEAVELKKLLINSNDDISTENLPEARKNIESIKSKNWLYNDSFKETLDIVEVEISNLMFKKQRQIPGP